MPSTVVILAKPLYQMLLDATEGLIESAYKHKSLLSKHFAENWNRYYLQVARLGGGQVSASVEEDHEGNKGGTESYD